MGRYKITKDDVVVIDIFIRDPDDEFHVLSGSEEKDLIQTLASEGFLYNDLQSEDLVKRVEAANTALKKHNIVMESACWGRKAFKVHNMIVDESAQTKPGENFRTIHQFRYDMGHFKYLLKGWTLDMFDPELKLEFADTNGTQALTPLVQKAIHDVEEVIIKELLEKYLEAVKRKRGPTKN